MPKFIISWDAGYGNSWDIVEADTEEKALEIAHEEWKEEAEGNAGYTAEPYTKERAIDEGLEDEGE